MVYFYIALAIVAASHTGSASKASPKNSSSAECKSKNIYYPIEDSCDSYLQCTNYHAATMMCPDGLYYNHDNKWPNYPCAYPADVTCATGKVQPALPTADCPHQYGYFPSLTENPEDCSHYRLCTNGHSVDLKCPKGLAFNPVNSRCDWPQSVASCKNKNDMHGFSCPPAPVDDDGQVLDTVVNYKYPDDCYYFYSCQLGESRLLSCDDGFAFDPDLGRCVEEDEVECIHPRAALN